MTNEQISLAIEQKLGTALADVNKKLDTLLFKKSLELDEFILAAEMARKLGLNRTYFKRGKTDEHFEVRKCYGQYYVKPCEEISNLLKEDYICVAQGMSESEDGFDYVIRLKYKKLCFWKGL